MDDAMGSNQPAEGERADDQLADRYAVGAQLGQNGRVKTFHAMDRRLDRPVVMVVENGSGGETLVETCQALTGVLSPNLVDIYDHGDSGTHHFVVCELPMSTVASLVEKPDESLWNKGWAIDTAEQLEAALADLNRSGVEADGLHFGYIGIDESGRVRLSPWPLAEHPDGSPTPASEQELVASVLESGVRAEGSSGSPKAGDSVAGLRRPSAGHLPLMLDLPPRALAGFGATVDEEPMGDVTLKLDLPPATPDGLVDSVYDKPTGEVPVTLSAVVLSQNAPSLVDRRHRVGWPLAAGVCLTGLAAFFAFSLVSSNPPTSANASTNAGSTIAGLQLPISPVSVSATTTVPPSTTTTTTPARTTPSTTVSGTGDGAIPPVGTAPATTEAPSTTTTTVPPSTSTTTEAPSTTTTTVPPSTTTTTTTMPPPTTTTTSTQ
jgi:hypothetical protein